jgi:hypothetical protein
MLKQPYWETVIIQTSKQQQTNVGQQDFMGLTDDKTEYEARSAKQTRLIALRTSS